MHDGSYVSIGWPSTVPDLSTLIREDKAVIKNQIRDWLLPSNEGKASVATRKAGEILNFAREMAENDLVLACEGQTVLGVGRIRGSYQYEQKLDFPHKRPVEWLLLDPWKMPDQRDPERLFMKSGKVGEFAGAREPIVW